MTNLSVFTPLMRQTVGFDRFNDLFETMLDNSEERFDSYPPYNIEKLGEHAYRITLAVAGFAESDIDITVQDDTLKVSGRKQETDEKAQKNWLHRGIANRAFERTFRLADYIQVENAKLENGLLSISMKREVPEEKKPRMIPINAKSTGLLGQSKKK